MSDRLDKMIEEAQAAQLQALMIGILELCGPLRESVWETLCFMLLDACDGDYAKAIKLVRYYVEKYGNGLANLDNL